MLPLNWNTWRRMMAKLLLPPMVESLYTPALMEKDCCRSLKIVSVRKAFIC